MFTQLKLQNAVIYPITAFYNFVSVVPPAPQLYNTI